MMLEYEILAVAVAVIGGGFTAWMQLSNNIARLSERVDMLERSEDKVNEALKELLTMVQEIKLLLAEKGIKS
jgi:prefoldin subunit 5